MSAASPGAAGPHPDLTALIAASLNALGRGATATPAQVTVLQRRTFAELPHPHPRVGGRIALASCLALLHGTAQETLVLFEAMRPTGAEDWGPGGNLTTMAVDARRCPFTAVGSIIPRTGLNVGVLIAAPDVAAVRIELADGTSVEDTPCRRSIQVVALFRSPAAWAGDATVRVLDSAGKELATQRLAMSPGGPPGLTPPGR